MTLLSMPVPSLDQHPSAYSQMIWAQVPCPSCGADRGEPCFAPSRARPGAKIKMELTHRQREIAWHAAAKANG